MVKTNNGVLFVGLSLILVAAFSLNYWVHRDTMAIYNDDLMPFVHLETTKPTSTRADDFRSIVKKYEKTMPPEIPLDVVLEFYDRIGPEDMLTIIEENPLCHEQGHNIGKIIYRQTKDFDAAMDVCGLRCAQGCFHGILMEMTQDLNVHDGMISGAANENNSLKQFVQEFCPKIQSSRGVNHVYCYHGLGHALMFLANDNITRAIQTCEYLKEEGNRFYCATGIYMQYFLNYGSDGSFYPCTTHEYPAACFRYKFAYGERSLDLLEVQKKSCLALPRAQQLACVYGLGHGYESFVRLGQLKFNELCSGDPDSRKICIDGVIISLAFYDEDKAIGLCNTLEEEFKDHCLHGISIKDNPLDRSFENFGAS